MKNSTILLVISSITLVSTVAHAQNDTVLISEVRYKNHSPVFWDQRSRFTFYWLSPTNQKLIVRADSMPKERYYPGDPGTEVVLHLLPNMFDPHRRKLTLYGVFYSTPDGAARSTQSKEKEYTFDLTNVDKLNQYCYKAYEPIEIAEPETFSLVTITNYINKRLFESSTVRGGFAATVDALNNLKDDYYNDRKIKFKTLLNFFKLYEFLDEFAPDQSFYNQEAKALYSTLVNPANQQPYTSYSTKFINDTTFNQEQAVSNQVYREYMRTYALIREYHSRLELILFFKSR